MANRGCPEEFGGVGKEELSEEIVVMFIEIIKTMRPKQWVKNGIIFAALLFAQEFFNPAAFLTVTAAFFVFCGLSGSVYIINDVLDRQGDSFHPAKRSRPIAGGNLSVRKALTAALIVLGCSLPAAFSLGAGFGFICLIYLAVNLAYTLYLKHLVIIDVMTIALGFVLRAVAGGVVIGVEISHWLIICTILLSLFLGFGKRRHELVLLGENKHLARKILSEYSPYFLDQLIVIVAAATVVAYSLYTMSPDVTAKLQTARLNFTIPFVLYGIFRYLYLVHQKEKGGSPARILLTDKPLLIDIVLWLITAFLILYF